MITAGSAGLVPSCEAQVLGRGRHTRAQRDFRPFSCDCRRSGISQLQALRQSQGAASVADLGRSGRPATVLCRSSNETSGNAASSSSGERAAGGWFRDRGAALRQAAAAAAIGAALLAGPVSAADVAKVGTCLLSSCQGALARCMADGVCLENLVCLQLCNGKPDESACQIRCGDLYNDKAVEAFTACAVSDKKCVPQRVDADAFPVPKDDGLDENFDLDNFQGRWYITAGLNPLFDTFDCQAHFFGVPEPGKLLGKINWRINKGDDDFIERSTMQKFIQDPVKPAVLRNRGNEYLHYEDDWYILGFKPDKYALIYYRGNNDAWQGYGGATVYTKEPTLPAEYIPELKAAAQRAGLKWTDFQLTDNSCKPHPPAKSILDQAGRLEASVLGEARKDALQVEYALENDLTSFGKGFTVLEKNVLDVLQRDEEGIARSIESEERLLGQELEDARRFLDRIEAQYVEPNAFVRFLRAIGIGK
ncbi:hypothetical protein WJX81_003704 [Elliptochloris bilobata]|uniref:VDE lipocalin domain-containing protein n=1 Tax=Elliptochloris bilobata TaxID=381761 RepID=A0AAW1RIW7_9CHLO